MTRPKKVKKVVDVPHGKMRTDKKRGEDNFGVTRELKRLVKAVGGYSCAELESNAVHIKKDADIHSFIGLVDDLDNIWYASEIKGVLLKFYIGDAINEGRDIFGEEYAQVFGERSHWSPTYLSRIRWVCKRVPPEHRSLFLNSWIFHQAIADFDYEDQAYFVKKAEALKRSGNSSWYAEVREEMRDYFAAKLFEVKPEAELDFWHEAVLQLKPTPQRVRRWIKGKERPQLLTSVEVFIHECQIELDERYGRGEAPAAVLGELMYRFADEIRKKKISLERHREQ